MISANRNTAAAAAPCRVLVVEDNEINSRLAVLMLEQLGCSVVVARDGRRGVDRFLTGKYAVVLMDCHMPVMDGYEAARKIREIEAMPDADGSRVPIIAMTANAMGGERARCLAAGMDDYITKPVKAAVLREVLSGVAAMELPVDEMSRNAASPDSVRLMRESVMRLAGELSAEAAVELLESWIAEAHVQLPGLNEIAGGAHQPVVRRAAHSLKGSAALFGLSAMEELCQELEDLAEKSVREGQQDLAQAIGREFKESLPLLGELLEELKSAVPATV